MKKKLIKFLFIFRKKCECGGNIKYIGEEPFGLYRCQLMGNI